MYDSGRPSVNTPGKYDTHVVLVRKGYDLYHHITPKKGQCHERIRLDLRFLRNWRQQWHRESSRAANISRKMMTIFYTAANEVLRSEMELLDEKACWTPLFIVNTFREYLDNPFYCKYQGISVNR